MPLLACFSCLYLPGLCLCFHVFIDSAPIVFITTFLFQNSHVHTQTIKACVATNKHQFTSNTINDFKWVLVTRKKSCICRRKWHFKRDTHSLFNLRNRVCISLASPLRTVFRLLSFKSLFLEPPFRLHEQINTRLYPERCSVTIIWKNRKH